MVDPRRADDTSPFKGLCGAGVAFKLCAALDGCPPEEMLDYCGDLAAVGTVADVMPLTGENRTLVKAGLHLLQHSDRPGLLALLDEVGLCGQARDRRECQLRHCPPHQRGGPDGQRRDRPAAGAV